MKNKIYILLFIIGLSYSSCKKFPEDPFISLRTVKMRIKSEWKLNKILINGNDLTQNYNDSLINENFTSMNMNLIKDGETSDYAGVINSEGKTSYANGINLNKDKSIFFKKWDFNSGTYYAYDTINLNCINRILGLGKYKVIKLYRKDFIIEGHSNNNTIEIQFKK